MSLSSRVASFYSNIRLLMALVVGTRARLVVSDSQASMTAASTSEAFECTRKLATRTDIQTGRWWMFPVRFLGTDL